MYTENTDISYVVEIVKENPGIKSTELATKLTIKKCENSLKVEGHEIVKAIDEAVTEGLILEIEYVLPSMPYRITSVYFPTNTKLIFKGKELWNK